MNNILKILILTSFSGGAMVLGGYLGTKKIPDKILAFTLTFGAGVLLAVVSFTLMHKAYNYSGPVYTSAAFILGGCFFYKLEGFLSKKLSSGMGIIIGTAMDDLPEALSMGIGFATQSGLGTVLALSIFLHNIPEGISSISELVDKGSFTRRQAFALAVLIAFLDPISALIGYSFLHNLEDVWLGLIMAFSGGGILFMTGTDMIPKAHKLGNKSDNAGILFGFLAAFLLSKIFGQN